MSSLNWISVSSISGVVCVQVRPPSYDVDAATPLRGPVASKTSPLA
ncbi:hypothetical protein [Streptomyces sp. NPDC001604]